MPVSRHLAGGLRSSLGEGWLAAIPEDDHQDDGDDYSEDDSESHGFRVGRTIIALSSGLVNSRGVVVSPPAEAMAGKIVHIRLVSETWPF